ncbi:hypothetical protein DMB38_12925 [Streptomyces sp. WAC 06738]|uniref:hypothetical protein n=1 Tax=Streptomyces sp. WAC 06738 TaxID=2203210 RepID=UPI000F701208|nr:hypothetical protein [Streptomyces sp. WAC 06738]AZM46597.1 hypothetical protein DMB38_12925 [Streptomyces sp. WAC 06738]
MDQGDISLLVAGMGIAGTLFASLGTTWLQSRASQRQVRDQEAVDVRHRLREERQVAYAAVLDRLEEAGQALEPIMRIRIDPREHGESEIRDLWREENRALRALQRAVTTVAITGTEDIANLAQRIYDAAVARANTERVPMLSSDTRVIKFAEASGVLEEARSLFVGQARMVLGPPGE